MTAVVVAEAVAIGLLTVLVAGLLRTQARIVAVLRQGGVTGPPASPATRPSTSPQPSGSGGLTGRPAPEVSGVDLDGRPARLETQMRAVLAFLTSGCTSCAWWWEQLGLAGHALVGIVVVTPDPGTDAPEDVRPLAGERLRVIMSSDAWEAYGVRGGSTFVVVEGGTVQASGDATTWDELMTLVGAAGVSERER